MFRCRILLLLIVASLSAAHLPAKDSQTTLGVDYACSVSQGFNFQTGVHDIVGHLYSITIGGTAIPGAFTLKDPTAYPSTSSAIGVLSSISWAGGAGDGIALSAQVSSSAKTSITSLIHAGITNTAVDFQFIVYDYDPVHLTYFKGFHSNNVTLHGLIKKESGVLQIAIATSSGTEVVSPSNYQFDIQIMPQAIEQQITYSPSAGTTVAKQWGISVGEPVELAAFTAASLSSGSVLLQWKTATEVNHHGFGIERRKAEERAWTTIGFVPGNGTSNVAHDYSFLDRLQESGRFEYRLKLEDRDGNSEYSNVIDVSAEALPTEFALAQNFPNPFNASTKISFTLPASEHATLSVSNALGQLVKTLFDGVVEAGRAQRLDFDGAGLPSGVYFYTLKTSSHTDIKRMVLLK